MSFYYTLLMILETKTKRRCLCKIFYYCLRPCKLNMFLKSPHRPVSWTLVYFTAISFLTIHQWFSVSYFNSFMYIIHRIKNNISLLSTRGQIKPYHWLRAHWQAWPNEIFQLFLWYKYVTLWKREILFSFILNTYCPIVALQISIFQSNCR